MRYENKREPRVPPKIKTLPDEPGFYWAKWRICDEGTVDEAVFQPNNHWEVVEVLDEFSGDKLPSRVFVAGVEKSQSIENFVWARPIAPRPTPAKGGK